MLPIDLTWQATTNHRFDYLLSVNVNDRPHRRDPPPAIIEDAAAWKQHNIHTTTGPRYTAVFGSRTVFESAFIRRSGYGNYGYQPGADPTDIRIEDPVRDTASVASPGHQYRPNARTQFNNTLTFGIPERFGSHNFKVGVQYARQYFETQDERNGDLDIIYNNGVPNSVRIYNTPTQAISYTNQYGFFIQDDWRLGRMTLSLGGRLDFMNGWNDAVDVPAGRFIGARRFDRRDVISQHLGVWRSGWVYDVRGDGRTALKVNYSRYGIQVGIDRVTNVNPTVNASGTRAWTDQNGDRIPQDNELGPFSGFVASSARYTTADGPNWPYADEVTAGIEQQIGGDMRVGAMYYHRRNRQQVGRRNVAVPTSAYTEQTISVPGSPTGAGTPRNRLVRGESRDTVRGLRYRRNLCRVPDTTRSLFGRRFSPVVSANCQRSRPARSMCSRVIRSAATPSRRLKASKRAQCSACDSGRYSGRNRTVRSR